MNTNKRTFQVLKDARSRNVIDWNAKVGKLLVSVENRMEVEIYDLETSST